MTPPGGYQYQKPGTRVELITPIVHRVGNYHIWGAKAQIRVAAVHISLLKVVQYIGYEMRSALGIEAKIWNREFLKVDVEHDIVSQTTLDEAEKRLEQVRFLAEHLDLQPITDKIKEVAQSLRSRVKDD